MTTSIAPSPAGRFDQRVIIHRRSDGRSNGLGESVPSLKPAAERWASVEPLSARELLRAGDQAHEITHRIRMRHTDVCASDEIEHRNRRYRISSLIDVGGARVELELLCAEVE